MKLIRGTLCSYNRTMNALCFVLNAQVSHQIWTQMSCMRNTHIHTSLSVGELLTLNLWHGGFTGPQTLCAF
eukprot:c33127_g1_i1 orf=20-232(-)